MKLDTAYIRHLVVMASTPKDSDGNLLESPALAEANFNRWLESEHRLALAGKALKPKDDAKVNLFRIIPAGSLPGSYSPDRLYRFRCTEAVAYQKFNLQLEKSPTKTWSLWGIISNEWVLLHTERLSNE